MAAVVGWLAAETTGVEKVMERVREGAVKGAALVVVGAKVREMEPVAAVKVRGMGG